MKLEDIIETIAAFKEFSQEALTTASTSNDFQTANYYKGQADAFRKVLMLLERIE